MQFSKSQNLWLNQSGIPRCREVVLESTVMQLVGFTKNPSRPAEVKVLRDLFKVKQATIPFL